MGVKRNFWVRPSLGGENGDAAVVPAGDGQLCLFGLKHRPHIAFRVVGLHLIEENVPHLVVPAEILNLPHHFIGCHKPTPSIFFLL